MTTTANQRAFNRAYRGLKSQGFGQSKDATGYCVYRASSGRKCAAGWLIADSKYRGSFEGHGCTTLPRSLFGKADMRLIERLQAAHDWSKNPADMEDRLKEVADKFALAVPSL